MSHHEHEKNPCEDPIEPVEPADEDGGDDGTGPGSGQDPPPGIRR